MEHAKIYFVIFLGGGLGSMLRFFISVWIGERYGESFPWGTIIVNIAGCFLIGVLAALFDVEGRFIVSPIVRLFLMIGFLGGFTTFSSFSLQTLKLAQDGQWLGAAANCAISLVCCIVGVWAGFSAGHSINQ
ncbi:MAG: fluoride efflux transporter CrcB [Chthoniobacterales bacterium]